MTRKRGRREKSGDELDMEQSRRFERGEDDTPEDRRLLAKAWRTRDLRVAARRQLEALGDVALQVFVRAEGDGWVAYLPHLGIRGDGPTIHEAERQLRRAFDDKVAIDPIGALEGIRATARLRPVVFKVRPSA